MTEEAQSPESEALKEKMKDVYKLYQRNIRAVDPLVYRITLGARNGVPEEELLRMAAEAMDKCDFGENLG